jgi:SPP1 family predicted phage head-tail adaptor
MAEITTGQLRHRLTLERATLGPAAKGGQRETKYEPIGTFWASVEPFKGAEIFQAAQLKAVTPMKIVMRAGPTVKTTDRLRFEGAGRIFNILSVYREYETNAYLIITADELMN